MNPPDLRRILKEAPVKGVAIIERTARDILFNKRTLVIILLICIPGLIGAYWSVVIVKDIPRDEVDLREVTRGGIDVRARVPQWLPADSNVTIPLWFTNEGSFMAYSKVVVEFSGETFDMGVLEVPVTSEGEPMEVPLFLNTTGMEDEASLKIKFRFDQSQWESNQRPIDLGEDLIVDDPEDVPVELINPILEAYSDDYYEDYYNNYREGDDNKFTTIFNGKVEIRNVEEINHHDLMNRKESAQFTSPVSFGLDYPIAVGKGELFNITVTNTTPLGPDGVYDVSIGLYISSDNMAPIGDFESVNTSAVFDDITLVNPTNYFFVEITLDEPNGQLTLSDWFVINTLDPKTTPLGDNDLMVSLPLDKANGPLFEVHVPSQIVLGYPIPITASVSGSSYWDGQVNMSFKMDGNEFTHQSILKDGLLNETVIIPEEIFPQSDGWDQNELNVNLEYMGISISWNFTTSYGQYPPAMIVTEPDERVFVPPGLFAEVSYPWAFTTKDKEEFQVTVKNTGLVEREGVVALYVEDEVVVSNELVLAPGKKQEVALTIPPVLEDAENQNFTVLLFLKTGGGYNLVGGTLIQDEVIGGTYDVEVTKQVFLITFIQMYLYTIVLLVAFIYARGLIGSELENRTMTITMTAPVTRLEICGYKYIGYLLTLTLICAIPVIVSYFTFGIAMGASGIISSAGLLGASLFMIFLSVAAYGALFMFIGSIHKYATIGGLFYLFLFEMVLGRMPFFIQKISIGHYIRSAVLPILEPYGHNMEEMLMLQNEMTGRSLATSQPISLLVLVIISILFLGLTIMRVRGMDIN